MFIIVLGPTRG